MPNYAKPKQTKPNAPSPKADAQSPNSSICRRTKKRNKKKKNARCWCCCLCRCHCLCCRHVTFLCTCQSVSVCTCRDCAAECLCVSVCLCLCASVFAILQSLARWRRSTALFSSLSIRASFQQVGRAKRKTKTRSFWEIYIYKKPQTHTNSNTNTKRRQCGDKLHLIEHIIYRIFVNVTKCKQSELNTKSTCNILKYNKYIFYSHANKHISC